MSLEKRPLAIMMIALSTCVPASEKLPPAGAAGVTLEPSASLRGEPFSDGAWTLTTQKVIARVAVSVWNGRNYGAYGDPFLINAMKRGDVYSTALPTGPAKVQPRLIGRYVSRGESSGEDALVLGFDDEADVRSFERPSLPLFPASDDDSATHYDGPYLRVVVRGERAGRAATLDVELRGPSFSSTYCLTGKLDSSDGLKIDVRENDLTLVPLATTLDEVFGPQLPFDTIASADADGDGTVSEAELRQKPGPPESAWTSSCGVRTVYDVLRMRLTGLLFAQH